MFWWRKNKKEPVTIHLHVDDKRLVDILESLNTLKIKINIMAKKQSELAEELRTLGVQLGKIGTETSSLLTKVSDLEAAIANAGNVTDELQAAFDAVKVQAQVVDDLVPDAPAPTEG